VKLLDTVLFPQYHLLLWSEVIICTALATVSAFGLYKIFNSKHLSSLLRKVTSKSINDDLWRDVIDVELGTIITLFLKNQSTAYKGKLASREEKGFDSWFLLEDYIRIDSNGNIIFDSDTCLSPMRAMIPLCEVERVELRYHPNTKVFDRWK
jgi:hypothetical protein